MALRDTEKNSCSVASDGNGLSDRQINVSVKSEPDRNVMAESSKDGGPGLVTVKHEAASRNSEPRKKRKSSNSQKEVDLVVISD